MKLFLFYRYLYFTVLYIRALKKSDLIYLHRKLVCIYFKFQYLYQNKALANRHVSHFFNKNLHL